MTFVVYPACHIHLEEKSIQANEYRIILTASLI